MKPPSLLSRIGAALFFAVFAAFGVFALWAAWHNHFLHKETSQIAIPICLGLIFAFIGFGGFYGSLIAKPKADPIEPVRAQHPDEPWLWKSEWSHRKIASHNGRQAAFFWGFGLLWNLISTLPILIFLPEEWNKGNHAAAFGLLFVAAGIWLLWRAVSETRRWMKYGESVFIPETMPGVIGGGLKGSIQTRVRFASDALLHIKLMCIERTRSGSGKNSSTWEKILWQEETDTLPQPALQSDGSVVPVAFAIPSDCQPVVFGDSYFSRVWRLQVSASGADFLAQFEVPVFAVEGAKVAVVASETPIRVKVPVSFDPATCQDVRVQPSPLGGKEFFFPPLRHLGVAAMLFVFVLIFGGSTVFLIRVHAPLLFPIVFGGFTLLILLINSALAFGQTRVIIEGSGVRVGRGLLGVTLMTMPVADTEIQAIALKIGTQQGERVFYDIQLVRKDGRKVGAGGMIQSKREAEWVASEMARLMNLKSAA